MAQSRNALLAEIAQEVVRGNCILFLGAGSSLACESQSGGGLTGLGLAQSMIEELGEDPANFNVTLQEASEFYEVCRPAHRRALNEFIYRRLHDLRPSLGHILLTTLPWKAIITTNYNRAVESGYELAAARGITRQSCMPLRTDKEVGSFSPAPDQIALYKPHGCLALHADIDAPPMVLTAKDYFNATKKRVEIYNRIKHLAGKFSTLFVGYSLVDYNFNNIYYELRDQLDDFMARSYTVIPVPSNKAKYMDRVYSKRDIELIDDKFDTFIAALVEQAGFMSPAVKDLAIEELKRPQVVTRLGTYAQGLPPTIQSDLISSGIAIP
jgi:SIR2-like domain